MSSFLRALLMAWSYRLRFALSVVCALLVAVLWGANLSTVYPILKVFFHKQNLQAWIDEQVETDRESLRDLELQIEGVRGKLETIPSGPAYQRALGALAEESGQLERDRVRTMWRLRSHERLQP